VSGAELICKDETISHADVFAAIYEGNRLFSVSRGQITQKHGYNETFSVSFSQAILPQDIKEITVKLLFVNNSQSLKPIIPAYTYVAKEEINFNPVVYVAGDSTACNYGNSSFPQTGWGQVLGNFFTDEVTVENHAMGGRSAKSFMDEGRLDTIFSKIQPGDYLLIQFGHNDQKKGVKHADAAVAYPANLKKMIADVRAKGATPVLVTSIVRCVFDKGGSKLKDGGLYAYRDACFAVGKSENVAVVNFNGVTEEKVNALGKTEALKLYMYTSEIKGRKGKDITHLNKEGAVTFAGWFVEECKKQNLPVAKYFK
jgi:lysophospholipase L1-like esterase